MIYYCAVFVFCIIYCCAEICHQNEIPDGFSLIQREQEIIQQEKEKCLQSMLNVGNKNGTYCNQIFDGIMCWPPAEAGSISIQPCPGYIYSFSTKHNASRICLPNGEWYVHPDFNTTWTNLTACFNSQQQLGSSLLVPAIILKHMKYIQILYDVGYSISLVSLVLAVVIMIYFRNLHCQRNTIHINMFVSFILRSIICFIKDIYVIPEVDRVYNNDKIIVSLGQSNGCKVVYTLFHYLVSTNFMWIFIEGIYMHTFVQSTKYNVSTRVYRTLLIFGWGLPCTFIIPWVIVRITYENTLCWSTHDVDNGYFWIIKGPITATVIINFIFFVNIIRVLYVKLTSTPGGIPKRYRKLAKSTLILIPLFGVYYIAFIAVPQCMKPVLELIWMYTEMCLNSFQGFTVAVLFCFMNEEVRRNILATRRRLKFRRTSYFSTRSRSVTGYMYTGDQDTQPPNDPLCNDDSHDITERQGMSVTNNEHDKHTLKNSIVNGTCNGESNSMV